MKWISRVARGDLGSAPGLASLLGLARQDGIHQIGPGDRSGPPREFRLIGKSSPPTISRSGIRPPPETVFCRGPFNKCIFRFARGVHSVCTVFCALSGPGFVLRDPRSVCTGSPPQIRSRAAPPAPDPRSGPDRPRSAPPARYGETAYNPISRFRAPRPQGLFPKKTIWALLGGIRDSEGYPPQEPSWSGFPGKNGPRAVLSPPRPRFWSPGTPAGTPPGTPLRGPPPAQNSRPGPRI